jgi:hypothetical protein
LDEGKNKSDCSSAVTAPERERERERERDVKLKKERMNKKVRVDEG